MQAAGTAYAPPTHAPDDIARVVLTASGGAFRGRRFEDIANAGAINVLESVELRFALLRYGRTAFNARIGMIDLAEKTVDLQVYIWDMDETGLMLTERLERAADRGVRIRLLIDDLGLGATDEAAAALDAHPNIEIRLFNPFAHRDVSALDFL